MRQYSNQNNHASNSKRNPSNDRLQIREISDFQINKRGNEHSNVLNRIEIERGGFFEQDSKISSELNSQGQIMFDNNIDPSLGEITGDVFNTSLIDRGLPLRAQTSKKRQQYDQNEHLDFDLYDSKPSTLKVTNFDPTLIQGSTGTGFADVTTSMTNMSTQLSPVTLCSTQIDRLGNNLFYFLYDVYDRKYIVNGFGIFELFTSLYFSASSMTEIELKKMFDFPKKEELFNGMIKIRGLLNTLEKIIKFNNFIIIGKDVPYDPKYYETIKEFCTLIRVDTSKPFSESKNLNEAIKKIVGMGLRNTVTAENLENLQLMLLTTCVVRPIWETPFDQVINGKFYTYGQEENMKFLHSVSKSFGYFEDNTHQILEIKCAGEDVVMGIVLHKTEIANDVDDLKLHYFISHMKECILDEVKIPIFTTDCKLRFNTTLQNLGLVSVFNKLFCPKLFPENAVLQDVVQNMKITVDETSIKSIKKEQKGYKSGRNFLCNKPFIYYFRIVKTNTIVLNGLFQ